MEILQNAVSTMFDKSFQSLECSKMLFVLFGTVLQYCRVAEVGKLSASAKSAFNSFVGRVFANSQQKTLFFRVLPKLQQKGSFYLVLPSFYLVFTSFT